MSLSDVEHTNFVVFFVEKRIESYSKSDNGFPLCYSEDGQLEDLH